MKELCYFLIGCSPILFFAIIAFIQDIRNGNALNEIKNTTNELNDFVNEYAKKKVFEKLNENSMTITWHPASEAPTEIDKKNPNLSPMYIVLCKDIDENGNHIIGYSRYIYSRQEWYESWRTVEAHRDYCHTVLYWTDSKF